VGTEDQLADIFTKHIDEKSFCKLRNELNILDSAIDSGARRVAGILVAVAGVARAPHFASARKLAREGQAKATRRWASNGQ
jgi:hypothetical protein